MNRHYGFNFDTGRCVQCHACEIACKSKNNIELGVKWRRVIDIWHGSFPDVTNRTYSIACNHCAGAPCEAVCPVGAIEKRREDGIVIVHQDKCIGCHSCFLVCPFGAPQFGDNGRIQKCHMCIDRLKEGKEPACVATCPVSALTFGTMEELAIRAQKKSALRLARSERVFEDKNGDI